MKFSSSGAKCQFYSKESSSEIISLCTFVDIHVQTTYFILIQCNNVLVYTAKYVANITNDLIYISGYQTTEYKAEPVGYSALHAYGAPYFSACHCLSSLDLNILR